MADDFGYALADMRFTAIYLRIPQAGGADLFQRIPFDLVRFNVTQNPGALPFIMPVTSDFVSGVGLDNEAKWKRYERIWVTDTYPFKEANQYQQSYGPPPPG